MKIAVISDIHSNLEALVAALKAILPYDVSAIYCLGDIVGYGPEPGPCVDLVRKVCTAAVRGNHDEAVAFERGIPLLPKDGQQAAVHNRANLNNEQLAYLQSLPLFYEAHGCTFVHATPKEPNAWYRLDSIEDVVEQFNHFRTDVCFVGHTHVPAIVADRLGVFRVRPGLRYLINVGSVGQPRDHNPQLSFGIFDTKEVSYENVRAPYDIKTTAAKVVAAGLPERLGTRLMVGE